MAIKLFEALLTTSIQEVSLDSLNDLAFAAWGNVTMNSGHPGLGSVTNIQVAYWCLTMPEFRKLYMAESDYLRMARCLQDARIKIISRSKSDPFMLTIHQRALNAEYINAEGIIEGLDDDLDDDNQDND